MHCMLSRIVRRVPTLKSCVNVGCFFHGCRNRQLIADCNPRILSRSEFSCLFLQSRSDFSRCNYICKNLSTAVETDIKTELPVHSKGKKFAELENCVFHAYLENNPNYSETVHKSNTKLDEYNVSEEEFNDIITKDSWTRETADNYFDSFIKVASYCTKSKQPISETIFTSLCNAFPSKCIHFSDDQLIKCFICLQNWPDAPSVRDENFLQVWKAIDSVCIMKRMNWNLKKTLYMIDLWYSLKLTRLSEFVMKSISRCITKARRLTQYDLVQLMFYINTVRKVYKGQSLFEVEYQLHKVLQSLTIEEIGIVCAGFFKSQTRIHIPEMTDDIILMLMKHHENVDPVTLGSILKLVRYTQKDNNIESIKRMFDTLLPVMNKHPFQVCVHFALVSEPKQIAHPQVIENLIEGFISSPAEARLKDVEKICKIMSVFSCINSELTDKAFKLVISELESERREEELNRHPKPLIRCLCYMSYNKYFSEKLATKILNDDFLIDLYGDKYVIEREAVILDQNITLEFPEYKGNKLSTSLADYLCKKHSVYIPGMIGASKIGSSETNMVNLMNAVRTMSGDRDEFWHCTYFLPHFPRADVLIHLDKNCELLPVPPEIKKRKYFTGYIKPPKTSGHWLLFVSFNKSCYATDGQLTAEYLCKLRQLQLLGYTPVPVPYFDLIDRDTPEKRLDYVKEKVNSVRKHSS